MRFSVSHTQGLIACVVTRGRACGVDVERNQVSGDAIAHVSRFFADDERAQLAALPPAARAARFCELWVLKEAYLKATGVGLQRRLNAFWFPTPSPAGTIEVHDGERSAATSDRWRFDLIHPGPRHVLAVAVERGPRCSLQVIDLSEV
jgi:4'-phosphopantetheinyl transferase